MSRNHNGKDACPNKGAMSEANQRQLSNFDQLPNSAFARAPVVAGLINASEVTVWRWSKSGKLPRPQRIGGVTAWNVGELRQALFKKQ